MYSILWNADTGAVLVQNRVPSCICHDEWWEHVRLLVKVPTRMQIKFNSHEDWGGVPVSKQKILENFLKKKKSRSLDFLLEWYASSTFFVSQVTNSMQVHKIRSLWNFDAAKLIDHQTISSKTYKVKILHTPIQDLRYKNISSANLGWRRRQWWWRLWQWWRWRWRWWRWYWFGCYWSATYQTVGTRWRWWCLANYPLGYYVQIIRRSVFGSLFIKGQRGIVRGSTSMY